MGLIGRRWTRSNAWSRPVLIGRGLDQKTRSGRVSVPGCGARVHCVTQRRQPGGCVFRGVTAVMAEGKHPVTFRTRKLSPPAPMVLHGGGWGRVGRRRKSVGNEKGGAILGGPPLLHFPGIIR